MYRRLLPVEEVDLGLEVLVDERLTQLKQGTTGQESSQSVGSRSILADSSGKTKPRVLSRGCVLNPSTPQAGHECFFMGAFALVLAPSK